jgi:hypothetical protein
MSVAVIVSAEAEAQIEAIDSWWRAKGSGPGLTQLGK